MRVSQSQQAFEVIRYRYIFDSETPIEYRLNLDKKNWLLSYDEFTPQSWTKLEYNQCSHCPLKSSEYEHCPAAKNLSMIGNHWDDKKSFDLVHVEVSIDNRTVIGDATVQVALSSLIGLLLATSDCPYLCFFRPMARFHQPLGRPEDAGVRVLMSYLAYLNLKCKSIENIKSEISDIYDRVDKVNSFLAGRITQSMKDNASVQAIVQLDCLSKLIRLSIDESFEQLYDLFQPYEQFHSLNDN